MAVKRIGAGGPFLVGNNGDNLSINVCTFVSAGPKVADYSLVVGLGFFLASTVTPQGQANASEYQFGTHAQAIHQAEGVKSKVYGSVRTPPVVASSLVKFVQGEQQRYIDPFTGSVWTSQVSGAKPRTIPQLSAAPQFADLTIQAVFVDPITSGPTVRQFVGGPLQVDLTQQALFSKPPAQRQGAVPPITRAAPQADPSQIAAQVQTSQLAAPIVPNPIASFFSIPPQTEERPTRQVWSSQRAGQRPPVICSIFCGPQLYDFTQQALFVRSSLAPVVVSYAFRSIYGAPQLIDLTRQGWILGTAPTRQGRVRLSLWASQTDPSQIGARTFLPIVSALTPGVFPPSSPVHFRASPTTHRLGESTEALNTARLGEPTESVKNARLGEPTESVKTARLGEPTESPEAERLGSDDTTPPGRGLGS